MLAFILISVIVVITFFFLIVFFVINVLHGIQILFDIFGMYTVRSLFIPKCGGGADLDNNLVVNCGNGCSSVMNMLKKNDDDWQ